MIKAIISDFSRVILFPRNEFYEGGLNSMHEEKSKEVSYNFWEYYRLNEDLLNFYRSLKEKLKVYIFTTGRIQEYPVIQEKLVGIFDEIFTVKDLNLDKTDPQAYKELIRQISYKPEEVVFVDDSPENIEAATKAGMITYLYKDNQELSKLVKKYLTE